ncbi:MAG: hypothetical protein AAFR21_01995 [Pseudomonadota bacterium]
MSESDTTRDQEADANDLRAARARDPHLEHFEGHHAGDADSHSNGESDSQNLMDVPDQDSRQEANRVRFQGIVDASEDGTAPVDETGAEIGSEPANFETWIAGEVANTGHDWVRSGRRVMLISKLVAGFFVLAMIVAWPLGWLFAHRMATGSFEGVRIGEMYDGWVVVMAIFAPVLILFFGYLVAKIMEMMSAAEQIAGAARQLIQPDRNAVFNVESVGAAVRTQVDALNTGIDDALIRLASVEAMIRDHVKVIEETGSAIEVSTAGSLEKVASERARLIEMTENLNLQADGFASAIAERAQASIEQLSSVDGLTDEAEHRLQERMAHLENAAERALQSFDALGTALVEADQEMRATAQSIETSAGETEKASKIARKVASEAADSAARNAANVGLFANRATEEAKAAAEKSIEASRAEAEKAANAAIEQTVEQADRIAKAAAEALENVRASTGDAIKAASDDAEKAVRAADMVSGAAKQATHAAQSASSDVQKAGEVAAAAAQAALQRTTETTEQVDRRNQELAEARAGLEAENQRLETLIEEQRQRADRLAEAIATQTERLSKLAEAQLREQEAAARIAEAQAAMQAQVDKRRIEDEQKRLAELKTQEAARQAELAKAAEDAKKSAEAAKKTSAETEKPAAASVENRAQDDDPSRLDILAKAIARPSANELGKEGAGKGTKSGGEQKTGEKKPAQNAARRKDSSGKTSLRVVNEDSPRKKKASWKEILSATDKAEPIELTPARPDTKYDAKSDTRLDNKSDNKSDNGPANANGKVHAVPQEATSAEEPRAIVIISRLQNFTLNLERRLYGEPPEALLDRFDQGDRNVFANRLLRLNEADVKRRIRMENARDKTFERSVHEFLQGFEHLLEDATTSETADEELEEYLSSPLGRVYLLIGATVGYFA